MFTTRCVFRIETTNDKNNRNGCSSSGARAHNSSLGKRDSAKTLLHFENENETRRDTRPRYVVAHEFPLLCSLSPSPNLLAIFDRTVWRMERKEREDCLISVNWWSVISKRFHGRIRVIVINNAILVIEWSNMIRIVELRVSGLNFSFLGFIIIVLIHIIILILQDWINCLFPRFRGKEWGGRRKLGERIEGGKTIDRRNNFRRKRMRFSRCDRRVVS